MLSRTRLMEEKASLELQKNALEIENALLRQERDVYKDMVRSKTGRCAGTHCLHCTHNIRSSTVSGNVISMNYICDLDVPCRSFSRRDET